MSMSSAHGNICIIGPYPDDVSVIKGGVQASVYGMARSLATDGSTRKVKVISLPLAGSSPPKTRQVSVEGTDVLYLGARRFHVLAILHLPLILRCIRSSNSNIVHVHGTGLIQTTVLAILRAQRLKNVWTLHGITEKETLQKYHADRSATNLARHVLYKTLERFSIKTAPHIIVDTQYVADAIQAHRKVSVIPQGGVFSEEFASLQKCENKAPVILSIGVLKPRKGHHLTLEAFALLKQRVPSATLVIAGASPEPRYYESLKRKAEKLGIAASTQFLTNQPRHRILELYGRARVFALHSQEESQGLALCEALTAGLPVVATRSGDIPDVIKEGETGLLVEYGDVAGFADALALLLSDNGLHERMSRAAETAARSFDWKNITAKIIEVYNSL